MATAIVDSLPARLETRDITAVPWWQRRHTYALGSVVAGQVVLAGLGVRWTEFLSSGGRAWAAAVSSGLMGFLFAQCVLLGMWAALGGLSTVRRWLLVGAVGALGAGAIACQAVSNDWNERLQVIPVAVVVGWMGMAAFGALLLPLRQLAGWRIDFDAAYHERTGRKGQMTLMNFAAMFCAVAFPLALGRCFAELDEDAAEGGLLLFPFLGMMLLASGAPAAYAVLARRHTVCWLFGAALWLVVLSWGQSFLSVCFEDVDFFQGGYTTAGMNLETFAMHAGIMLAVALPLGMLRLFGLKLLIVA